MNRKELVTKAVDRLRMFGATKKIQAQKHVFHISDDYGNTRDFTVKRKEKNIQFTAEDVEIILEALLGETLEALKHGECVSIHGFGSVGVKYHKPKKTKMVGSDDWIDIDGGYKPNFSAGKDLRIAAKLYELSEIDDISDDVIEAGEVL